jgi:hypothetical protein
MAFLDNSGDIILDAVLTETGRKRLAEGRFEITQFGLGDDEINYGTYDLAHPSGSAYYDLEIMQTPVFEATTAINANINYGLLNLGRNDILYLPAMEFNEKFTAADMPVLATRTDNMFYLAVNTTTSTALKNDLSTVRPLIEGKRTGTVILIETGIDTDDVAATRNNVSSLIISFGLNDRRLTCLADSRFINSVGYMGPGSEFKNSAADNALEAVFQERVYSTPLGTSRELGGFNDYSVITTTNMIFEPDDGDDKLYSVINGPRASVTGLNFGVLTELTTEPGGTRSILYDKYGTTNSTSAGTGLSKTYDFIDTVVFVQGDSSGASLQIPLRIIRYVSG